ncbi:hypothetical protein BGW80DRAFT_1251277 [Lactifluus volemus]|nr:hypothetical protein BGW80DRAFT_1251277 [Lactifluus volemus]
MSAAAGRGAGAESSCDMYLVLRSREIAPGGGTAGADRDAGWFAEQGPIVMTKGRGGIEERGIKAVAVANHESWYYHPTIMKGMEGKEKKHWPRREGGRGKQGERGRQCQRAGSGGDRASHSGRQRDVQVATEESEWGEATPRLPRLGWNRSCDQPRLSGRLSRAQS